jgi:hypothetical protein
MGAENVMLFLREPRVHDVLKNDQLTLQSGLLLSQVIFNVANWRVPLRQMEIPISEGLSRSGNEGLQDMFEWYHHIPIPCLCKLII